MRSCVTGCSGCHIAENGCRQQPRVPNASLYERHAGPESPHCGREGDLHAVPDVGHPQEVQSNPVRGLSLPFLSGGGIFLPHAPSTFPAYRRGTRDQPNSSTRQTALQCLPTGHPRYQAAVLASARLPRHIEAGIGIPPTPVGCKPAGAAVCRDCVSSCLRASGPTSDAGLCGAGLRRNDS